MLKIMKRNTHKHDCLGFGCLVKKAKYPSLSNHNLSDGRQEPVAFPLDNVSDFELYTPYSSVTTLSSNGSCNMSLNDDIKVTKPHLQGKLEINDDSSRTGSTSLTPLSGTFTSWSNIDANKKMQDVEGDSDSFNRYSFTESSSLTPLSGVRTSWSDEHFQVTMALNQNGQRKSRDFQRPRLLVGKLGNISDTGRLKCKKEPIRLEIVGNGTRLMSTLEFPTVIVQMRKKKLDKSMVYCLILKSVAGRYIGDIAGLLFSNPHRAKGVQRAELLPLQTVRSRRRSGVFKLAPILLHERYKCLFKEGCIFEVKAIECGRRLEGKKRLWKNYDLKNWEIHDLLSRLLYLDISLFPTHLLKLTTPLRVAEHLLQKRRQRRRKSYKSLLKRKKSRVVAIQLSQFNPKLPHRMLNTGGGSNLADCYRAVPQQMHVDKHFVYDINPKESKSIYNNFRKFNKYLNISDII